MQADGFDVAGSFLLRSLAKPSLNVDLALRMPSECIVSRDSLNHRYLDKRALYAGHLAKAAMDSAGSLGKLVDKVEVQQYEDVGEDETNSRSCSAMMMPRCFYWDREEWQLPISLLSFELCVRR